MSAWLTQNEYRRALGFLEHQWLLINPQINLAPSFDRALEAILSGCWRRSRTDNASLSDARVKLRLAFDESRPLEFTVPFGGYKSWRVSSSPHLNWADVFAIEYLRRNACRIVPHLPSGIVFSLTYCSGVLDIVNNLPNIWQETYLLEMERLLRHFTDERITLRLFDIASLYPSPMALQAELEANYLLVKESWSGFPMLDRDKRLRSAARNLVLEGNDDLGSLGTFCLSEKIERSAMYCEALDRLSRRREFNKLTTRIQLVHVRGPERAIHVASCDTSSNHFGVSEGAVELRKCRELQKMITNAQQLVEAKVRHCQIDTAHCSRGYEGLQRITLLDNRETS